MSHLRNWLLIVTIFSPFPTYAQSYIQDWLVLGSFPHPDRDLRLKTDYLVSEAGVTPQLAAPCAGKYWLAAHPADPVLDLAKADLPFKEKENAVAYAAAWIQSPIAQSARLLCGSDDGLKAWLNGEEVLNKDRYQGLRMDSDTAFVQLVAGWNKLLCKVSNGGANWKLCARLIDADSLSYSISPPLFAPDVETAPFLVYEWHVSQFAIDSLGQTWVDSEFLFLARRRTAPLTIKIPDRQGIPKALVTFAATEAGAIRRAQIRIPLPAMVTGKAMNWSVEETSKPYPFVIAPAPAFHLLQKWFQPWSLAGWTNTDSGIEKSFIVPGVLAGLPLFLQVNIDSSWGNVRADGNMLTPRFSGDSGDLLFTARANSGDAHRFCVQIVRGPSALIESKLVLHHSLIENYIFSKQFAQPLFADSFDAPENTDSLLVEALAHGHVDNAVSILRDVMPLFEKKDSQLKQYQVSLLGNAHIDLMWLWRYPETIEVIKNTFASALRLMDLYPDFRFTHGQAQSYAWLEERAPDLFEQVKARVKEGRWEIIGGTWSQPDNNMPAGESLVRQYLYGKSYFKEKFGFDVTVGFMPDTFGHPASLPQILAKCGIRSYIFFRPLEKEKLFYWQSQDGSTVLAYRPPEFYNSNVSAEIGRLPLQTEKQFGIRNTLRCYGVGDHGGGPTERDVRLAKQLDQTTGYPTVQFCSSHDYFDRIRPMTTRLDTVRDELNFVYDGCWTSQAMTKWYNRRMEAYLAMAETFSVFAREFGIAYPQNELTEAWRGVLLNQFHDIFDGSGIGEIYPDVRAIYARSDTLAQRVLRRAAGAIAEKVDTRSQHPDLHPLLVFNNLNWPRQEPVTIDLAAKPEQCLQFFDLNGQRLSSFRQADGTFTVIPPPVPSFGYTTIFYKIAAPEQTRPSQRNLILQNRFLRVEVDYRSGHVISIYDRRLAQELLYGHANLLQLQEDKNNSMTAWTIRLQGERVTLNKPVSTRIIESNALRKIMRVSYMYGPSRLEQDIILYADLPRVDFTLRVDWHHRDTMLKIAFPLNIKGDAVFDIPFGHIQRPQTGREVVSQKWVDISNAHYGVTLLNDCKYGFDVQDRMLRMSALRSPHDPDPKADEGSHEMHYALYSHAGDWRQGDVHRQAMSYNTPMYVLAANSHEGPLAPAHSFFNVESQSLLVTACKKREEDDAIILRMQETSGTAVRARIDCSQEIVGLQEVNMMEEKIIDLPAAGPNLSLRLLPYEVRSLALYTKKRPESQ
jgi:alpha-mannosidase